VDEALEVRADLLMTHHPLLLDPVRSLTADTVKGAVAHRLVQGGCALLAAHTNADSAREGVSDALAAAVGITGPTRPLQPIMEELDTIVVFVPTEQTNAVMAAMSAAGAGTIESYDNCAWTVTGRGTFRPLDGASPAIGRVGEQEYVEEDRLEMVLPRRDRGAVVAAMHGAHPYEVPAFGVFEDAPRPTDEGLGRVGGLPQPMPLRQFAEHVRGCMPTTAAGIRVAGDADAEVTQVAVCGGSGGSLATAAADAGAEVLVTADLRHHTASDIREQHPDLALVDVSHWASEWLWLEHAAHALSEDCGVQTHVSSLCTEPWTFR
jgi:dinuclear metal center YbgI/SA1388 family protein